MKKFRFRLQKLLEIRIKKEDLLKQQFARLMQKLEQQQLKLSALQENLEHEKGLQRERRRKQPITAQQEEQFLSAFRALRNSIAAQQIQVNQALNAVNHKRTELIQASKERKIIEELREKQYREYLEAADKEEQKFIDEIATMAAARENELKLEHKLV